jgi:hypothetical protein
VAYVHTLKPDLIVFFAVMTKRTGVKGLLLVLLVLQAMVARAQFQLFPIPLKHSPLRSANSFRVEDDSIPKPDTIRLRLPFFEDFSTANKPWLHKAPSPDRPDTSRWMPGSGVYINNTLCLRPPSFNAATFDGIASNGRPYATGEPFATGFGDTLTSRYIDLSELSPSDALVLSFYWQAQGLGERPDEEDFIRVEFKNRNGQWVSRWQQNGNTNPGEFRQVFLLLNQAEFFHKDFQFRFRVSSRISGAYDHWHIDYILLNKGRSINETGILDVAASVTPQPFLKRYSAMPMEQYLANPRAETRDTIFSTVNNLDNLFNIISYDVLLLDKVNNQQLARINDTSNLLNANQRQFPLQGFVKDSQVNLPTNRSKMNIEARFRINTGETDSLMPPVNFRENDTISSFTVLDNYYAYDDGSAEYAIAFSQRFGKLAYKYELNTPATLTHIDILFVPLAENIEGETFNLRVWKSLDFAERGVRDSVLLIQNSFVSYPDSINKPTRIELTRRLNLSGSFYIGVEQLSDEHLTLGFDRNTNSMDKVYVNVANRWEQNTNIAGSILLRPVFKSPEVVGLKPAPVPALQATVIPNPSPDGQFFIKGRVSKVLVYDMQGRRVHEQEYDPESDWKPLQLQGIANGLYLFHLSNGQAVTVQKAILSR